VRRRKTRRRSIWSDQGNNPPKTTRSAGSGDPKIDHVCPHRVTGQVERLQRYHFIEGTGGQTIVFTHGVRPALEGYKVIISQVRQTRSCNISTEANEKML
jgi:hypothetical protein